MVLRVQTPVRSTTRDPTVDASRPVPTLPDGRFSRVLLPTPDPRHLGTLYGFCRLNCLNVSVFASSWSSPDSPFGSLLLQTRVPPLRWSRLRVPNTFSPDFTCRLPSDRGPIVLPTRRGRCRHSLHLLTPSEVIPVPDSLLDCLERSRARGRKGLEWNEVGVTGGSETECLREAGGRERDERRRTFRDGIPKCHARGSTVSPREYGKARECLHRRSRFSGRDP